LVIRGNDITHQELAEQMSEAQIQLALKAAHVGMWDWDLVADHLVWTEQQKALFGFTPDAPTNQERFLAAVHPADRERVDQLNAHALREQGEYTKDFRVIWPDGSVHRLSDRARGIYDIHGRPVHVVGATVDITELKQAQEQITAILESITDGFCHLDRQWRFTYVNRRTEAFFSKSREALLGKSFWEIFPTAVGKPVEHQLRKAMATRQTVHHESMQMVQERYFEMHIYPAVDGLALYFRDNTEHIKAQEDLHENETRFRRLVESNLIGIMVVDLQGTIHEANEAFLEMLGYNQQDVEAGRMQWKAMTPPDYQEQTAQAIEQLRTTGTFEPFEKEYLAKDGKRRIPVLIGGALFQPASSSQLVLCFILDLSARKTIERQKDLFLSMTSHELKTPLTALKGTLQLVERRMRRALSTQDHLSPRMKKFFDSLTDSLTDSTRQIDVQTRLINDLLDVSRITAGTFELERHRCDLENIVRQTIEDLRVMAPSRSLLLTLETIPERGQVAVVLRL
jgi:PAS domain S-box-containing protein